jgi:hypothetical protein
MAGKETPPQFRFTTTDTIGAAGAEDDEFLHECFVDVGLLDLLEDVSDRRLVLLGRTGAGKSALLTILTEKHAKEVIQISAEHLALTYVANSTILNFFGALGVNLDPFFKLLWRHVLTVEILSRHFEDTGPTEGRSLLSLLRSIFGGVNKEDNEMRQTIEYLEQWGKSFWQDTEYRVKEITNQVETNLQAQVKAALGPKAALASMVGGHEKITEEEKVELVTRGQDIIARAQVQDLQRVLTLLDRVLNNDQRNYYLIIDRLDEDWVEERLRYKLIMALLQTAREFHGVRHAKVIVALRRDLLDRVFRLARDSGFQEEKYHSLYLPLTWTKDAIINILDKRISRLVKRRYTSRHVTHRDVLPTKFRGTDIDQYIFEIAPRPRDVITFFNTCIGVAANEPKLNVEKLRLAEGEYSRQRLRALADEWSANWPRLADFALILQQKPSSFKVKTITDQEIGEFCLTIAINDPGGSGLAHWAKQVVETILKPEEFRRMLIAVFYQVGLVGLKLAPTAAESWADELGRSVSNAEIGDNTSVVVHPAYRRALGIVSVH